VAGVEHAGARVRNKRGEGSAPGAAPRGCARRVVMPHLSIAWVAPLAGVTIFTVMLSLGLLLGREHLAAALERRVVLAAVLFSVVVPVPALAVLLVKLAGLKGPVAAGIVLMAISPGAPVALRRAIDAGGHPQFAPALHLAIVIFAVLTVPLSVVVMDAIFSAHAVLSPVDVARQVFIAQLLPLGVGAVVRMWRPATAAWLAPRLARISNLMLLALGLVCVVVLGPTVARIGWAPSVAGVVLTLSALVIGAAFGGRDPSVRTSAAIGAAMRNPGLALLIASVNRAQPAVTASVFGYALGLAAVVTAFVMWRSRRRA
jgi:bile acid:Na+ symporter, BASS family